MPFSKVPTKMQKYLNAYLSITSAFNHLYLKVGNPHSLSLCKQVLLDFVYFRLYKLQIFGSDKTFNNCKTFCYVLRFLAYDVSQKVYIATIWHE